MGYEVNGITLRFDLPWEGLSMNIFDVKIKKRDLVFLIGLIVVGAISRLLPHLWNFTAIGAVSLFAGREFKNRFFGVLVPLGSMFLGDLFLGFYNGIILNYLAVIFVSLAASFFRSKVNGTKLVGWSLFASMIFFLLSNLGVWVVGDLYPLTLNGLLNCYKMGLPFLANQVVGDLFFTALVFMTYDNLFEKSFGKARVGY